MERLTIKEAINIALERVDYYAHLKREKMIANGEISENTYPSSADLFAEAVRSVVLLYPKKIVAADENTYGKMWVQEIDEDEKIETEGMEKDYIMNMLNRRLSEMI